MRTHYAKWKAHVRTAARRNWTSVGAVDHRDVETAAAKALADATLLISAPSPATDAPAVAVVMCVWNRHDRVTNMLRTLALSQDVSVDVYLWNNRAAAADDFIDEVRRCTHALPRTTVASCETNIGGFGRFYWARELAARYPYVIFLDDDQILDPFSLRDLVAAWTPGTIHGVWGFNFADRYQYWRRRQAAPCAAVKYVGTGGMVADSGVFTDDALFACPPRYWFMEDIWLSYYARAVRGWQLYRSSAEIGMIHDEKNQYHGLRAGKDEFYRELNKDARWADVG